MGNEKKIFYTKQNSIELDAILEAETQKNNSETGNQLFTADTVQIDLRKYTRLDLSELNKLVETVRENKCIGDLQLNNELILNLNESYIMRKLNKEIKLNNTQYERYPSDFTHALMCNHVCEENLKKGQQVKFNEEKWSIHEIYEFTNGNRNILERQKDYLLNAVLYFSKSRRQMVLAYSPNEAKLKSLFEDKSHFQLNINGILLNKIVPELSLCYEITQIVSRLAQENNCYLSFTGYSTGAWLAEHSNFYSSFYFSNKKTKAVLFESPGIFKNDYNSNIFSQDTNFKLEDLLVVNYLLAPNLFNSSNKHCGKCYRIYLDEKSQNIESIKFLKKIPNIGKRIYEKIKSSRFFLEGFLSMFNHDSLKKIIELFDYNTGKPKQFEKVNKWPIIKVNLSKKYDQNVEKLIKKPIKELISLIPIAQPLNRITDILENCVCKPLDILINESMPGIHLLLNVSIEMLEQNIDLTVFECKEFYCKNSKKEKEEKAINDFSMIFESMYHTEDVNLYREVLDIDCNSKNVDWCLDCLKRSTIPKTNLVSTLIYEQLNELKSDYIVKKDSTTDDKEIKVIESTQTIHKIRERFIRLTLINSDIRDLLYEASKLTIQTNEPRYECEITTFLPCSDKLDNNFIGRKEILRQMHKSLLKGKSVLLKAFAGSGKSRLAKEFGKQIKHDMKVRWFDAEKRNVLETSYKNLARIVLDEKLFNELNNQCLIKMISHMNNKFKNQETKMLFIFDNVEVFENISDIIHNIPSDKVKFLITSRNNLIENDLREFGVDVFELKSFNEEEAFDYIDQNMTNRTLSKPEKEKLVRILANDNEILPIKLYFAVKYCDENHVENLDNLINNENYIHQASLEEYLFEEVKNKSKTATIHLSTWVI